IYAGLHEFADMAFALHFLRAGDLFADGGANIGSYTVLASGVVGCRTVAFEPDPATAAALERNVSLNKIAERVELRISAVGEQRPLADGVRYEKSCRDGRGCARSLCPDATPGQTVVREWPHSDPDQDRGRGLRGGGLARRARRSVGAGAQGGPDREPLTHR